MNKKNIRTLIRGLAFLLFFLLLPVRPVPAAGEEKRVFDQAGLFDTAETEALEEAIASLQKRWEIDLGVVTVEDAGGKTAEEYADDFYDSHGMGVGSGYSGALLSIDMDNREIYLSTLGETALVLTDERVEHVQDAAYGPVSDGEYGKGALAAIRQIEGFMEAGIPAGQYNETRKETKRSLRWYEALFAFAAAGIVAAAPCIATVNRYKMKEEQRQALNYRLAYQGASAFRFTKEEENLVNRTVTQQIIPRNTGGSGRGGAPRGTAGRTTLHRSSSGRMHGGGGRRF